MYRTNEAVGRVGYYQLISGKSEKNNCFRNFQAILLISSGETSSNRDTTTTLSTTTGSEIQCTAQARLANFVVVVSSTTPNTVQSRRPASQASAGINPLFLGYFLSVLCIFLPS